VNNAFKGMKQPHSAQRWSEQNLSQELQIAKRRLVSTAPQRNGSFGVSLNSKLLNECLLKAK
jgi:hypothetical protein